MPDQDPAQAVPRRRCRLVVQRRTFSSEYGVSAPQWGFRDPIHGTWRGDRTQRAALVAASGEYAA